MTKDLVITTINTGVITHSKHQQSNSGGHNSRNDQNFLGRNDNGFTHGNGVSVATSFENVNKRQGNLNQSNWGGGGHNSTPISGREKKALRNMEEGYFVPARIGNLPLTFLIDTDSNATIYRYGLLDSLPQEHLPSLTPVNI